MTMLRVVVEQDQETGDFAVWCPELPGCASIGATEAEALANIKEAIVLYLEPSPIEVGPTATVHQVAV